MLGQFTGWVWRRLGDISLLQWCVSAFGGLVMGWLTWLGEQPLWMVTFVALGAFAILTIIWTQFATRVPAGESEEAPKEVVEPAQERVLLELNLKGNSAVVGNVVQGNAKITADGDGNIISDNAFGPNATFPSRQAPETEDERRRAVVEDLLSEWVLIPGHVDLLPFKDVDTMFRLTAPFINNRLSERGVGWRLTEETRGRLGF